MIAPLRRPLLIDLAIALAIVVVSAVWAASFWNTWTGRGNRGVFYQTYFEPAVMIACGKGFVISHPQPKPLEDFLFERVDRFNCADIPADNPLDTRFLYQGAWRYLLTTVGWAWWLLGVSWSGLGPFFGLWYGIGIGVAYGVFRLGVSRPAAVAACALLSLSTMQLLNLPHLRDFAKAPFTITLLFILALLAVRPVTPRSVLMLCAAYGAVLGIGYGFRTDFLINLPLLPIVAFGFLEGGVFRHLWLKTAGVALFAVTFVVFSWPITRAVITSGGCQWHVTLLGLQSPFDEYLRVTPAPYDFGHAYSDSYIDRTINGFRWRNNPAAPALDFCSHEYDVDSGQYLTQIVKTFPADFVTRAYASALQVLELPFRAFGAPMPDWHASLYSVRASLLAPEHRWGLLFGILAVLMVSAASVRLGAALVFLLAYFGGYPAVQFQERHYFHLEFMGWFLLAFVIDRAIAAALSLRRSWPERAEIYRGAARAAAFAVVTIVIAVGALSAMRWYQAGRARTVLQAYIDAPKTAITAGALTDISKTAWPQLLEIDLDERACGATPSVKFMYEADPSVDFKRTVTIAARAGAAGVTRIFQPVFDHYTGLEVSDPSPGCLVSASRVTDITAHPLVLGATLQPGWQSDAALYQRLKDWERDADRRVFTSLPAADAWTLGTSVTRSRTWLGAVAINGDASVSGFQLTSPVVQRPPGTRVTVRADVRQSHGHVCIGALDAGASKWVAPATGTGSEFSFVVDNTGGFIVAIANCNNTGTPEPSRFTVHSAQFTVEDGPLQASH